MREPNFDTHFVTIFNVLLHFLTVVKVRPVSKEVCVAQLSRKTIDKDEFVNKNTFYENPFKILVLELNEKKKNH